MNPFPINPAPSGFRGLIGAARQDITPPIGIFARNWGAAKRDVSEGIHRPLTLTCLTFQTAPDAPPLVLVGADLGWWRSVEDEWFVRGQVLEAMKLDSARLMICFSHTHSGPGLEKESATRPGGHLIEPYLIHLRDATLRAIRAALETRQPATLTWRYGRCDLAVNRDLPEPDRKRYVVGYNPAQSADDTLLVGRVSDASGQVMATVVNYACHPTTLAWDNPLISPDYIGAMREIIESQTASPCLFLQGASGELSPAEQYTGDTNVADRHGRRVGYAVMGTLEAMERPGARLAYDRTVESGAALGIWGQTGTEPETMLSADLIRVELPLKPLPSLAEIEQRWRTCDDTVQKERLWRQRGVRKAVGDGTTARMPLWIWRLGDSFFMGHANEAYSQLQSRLRAAVVPRAVAVIGLVNGSAGYLPPRDFYDREIYSVWQTPFDCGSLEQLIAVAEQALSQSPATGSRQRTDPQQAQR